MKLSYDRMMGYLPAYWHEYLEMKRLLKAYSLELDELDAEHANILVDCFILEMRKERLEEWERWLKLPPEGTLQDRRLAVLGYFFNGVKMSRESIQTLVAQMYNGARAQVEFYNSTIWIKIGLLPEYADSLFNYWATINEKYETWGEFLADQKHGWRVNDPFIYWRMVKKDYDNWREFLRAQKIWKLNDFFDDLYEYLWPRKPCHIHISIEPYTSKWRDIAGAGTWAEVSERPAWSVLTYTVWK